MKLRNIETYLNTSTGSIPYGEYYVEGKLKIGQLCWQTNNKKKFIEVKLLRTYNKGETISLKKHKNIMGYIVIFYEKLFNEENITLIKEYSRRMSKAQIMNFWTTHANELSEVFGINFDSVLLQTIFEIGRIPNQFEVVYNGNIPIKTPSEYREKWKKDKKSFKLLTYIK